ncbi:trypsin-like serine peptidase [Streptomyces noursei]|uniref:trypsin-like serine peptidase n=1 Tax=Streptomyces noursei TaxID=1971 RepID=UPI00056FDD23|nr:hypothetical protein [Streptomyces noursei]
MALIPVTLTTATAADAPVPASAAAPKVTSGVQNDDEQTVRDYWTPARIKSAVDNEAGDQAANAAAAKQAATKAATKQATAPGAGKQLGLTAQATRILPSAAGGNRSTAVAATDVPEMPHAEPVPFPQSWPAVVVGKILFVDHEGKNHGCSGASIAADGNNTVWTAGHCVHPGDGSGAAGFYDKVLFIPGYKRDLDNPADPTAYQAPWGEWVATSFVSPTAWTEDGDLFWGDMAAFTVKAPTGYTNLTDSVGALGYKFGSGPDWSDAIDSGFPADGYKRTDMDGYTQFYCTGHTEDATDLLPLDDRLLMRCDMGHGSSGGPMANTDGQIIGANSHGEDDGDGHPASDKLFSSAHQDNAVAVINKINELN